MKTLYFDCFSGISGDMALGALLDLGTDPDILKKELKKLNLKGYRIEIGRSEKNGINGTGVTVHLDNEEHVHAHEDSHVDTNSHNSHNHKNDHEYECHGGNDIIHTHYHRSFRDIRELIQNSGISERAKEYAIKIFTKLAEAEGKIHGRPADEVSFHEVGAVDSIVDIVGTSILIDLLNVDSIKASPVPLGSGMVKCQHGFIPVPAPATLEVLKGVPVYSNNVKGEVVTPTGAAILAALCDEFCEFPPMIIDRIGYGMGKKDFEIPNCLRVCVGELRKK